MRSGAKAVALVLWLASAALTLGSCSVLGHPRAASGAMPLAGAPSSGGGAVSTTLAPDCRRGSARHVSSASDLTAALATARPGEQITLAPGTYLGDFVATSSGRPQEPITLCGPRDAVLAGLSISRGYVFYLQGASWWRLEGFTVEGGQKGVVADGVSHDLLYGLYVHSIGDEAIHLRSFSSHNTVSHCVIRRTGLLVQFFGEGIYVGSAHKNWCRYTGCRPDSSNGNYIIDNNIAGTTAENIDIKEGATGGLIRGNHLDGAGMVSSAATAWINVKGNDWVVEDNVGIDSIGDGFQVHQVYPGWGIGNIFIGNHAQVDGPGYGIYVQSQDLKTIVACSNVSDHAGQGPSNQRCSGP